MFILYEYAACVLAVSTIATILFAAYVMVLVLIKGISILAQTLRKLGEGVRLLRGRRIVGETLDS